MTELRKRKKKDGRKANRAYGHVGYHKADQHIYCGLMRTGKRAGRLSEEIMALNLKFVERHKY